METTKPAPPPADADPSRRRRRRSLRRLLAWTAMAFLTLFVVAYLGIGWIMVDKAVTAERVPLGGTPADVGLAYQEVSFHPRGGEPLTLRGWYIPAADRTVTTDTLVLVHGLDSNRARDPATYLPMVRDLHDRGFALLLFDLRAHGESDGAITSGGLFERNDVLGALDFVVDEKGATWDRVGVLSYSLGAVATILAAADEPRLRAVVSDSAYADINDVVVKEAADRTPLSPGETRLLRPGMEALARLRFGIDLSLLKPERTIARLRFPLLIVHGAADQRFDVSYARRLKAAAADPGTQLWIVPGAGHAMAYATDTDEYVNRVSDYFRGRFAAMGATIAATPQPR